MTQPESRDINAQLASETLNQAVEYFEAGNYEEAIALLDKGLALDPNNPKAWNLRGDALYRLARYEEAIAASDRLIEINPNYAYAWFNRGWALYQLRRYEEAFASYNRAIEINPKNANVWNIRGWALNELGRYKEAIASFDGAIEINPNYTAAWYNRGWALNRLGRYEEAIASFNGAIEINPNNDILWSNRGWALHLLGRYEEAIASYNRAIEINPNDEAACNHRGWALNELGRYEVALASLNRAIEINPNYTTAWNNRGWALYKLGRYEEALASYNRAIEINPNNDHAWNSRGCALNELGRYKEAFASSTRAIEINPNNADAWKECARALTRLGRYVEAIASCEEGLKHCDKDTQPEGWGRLYRTLGNIYSSLAENNVNSRADWENAVAAYEQALKALTPETFPKYHLQTLKTLDRAYIRLGQPLKGLALLREGTATLQNLLAHPNTDAGKKNQLGREFARFNQVTVDQLVKRGDAVAALEVAEQSKNAFLTWLSSWRDAIPRINYAEIQQLLNPSTAIVYWHVSPDALTTFIVKYNAPEPLVLEASRLLETGLVNRLEEFEQWVKEWKEQYQDYRFPKKQEGAAGETDRKRHPWYAGMEQKLEELGKILNIPAILEEITGIVQLILIPHRDLHLLPLEALFPDNYTTSRLPSALIGRKLQQNRGGAGVPENSPSPIPALLSVEHPNSTDARGNPLPKLPFARVESAYICRRFANYKRLRGSEASREAVENELSSGYPIFHFTGHGSSNPSNPRQSSLALTEKQRLLVENIVKMNLSGCHLVSLSACETAVTASETITTEYVGLVSAFVSRQVSHVVSTLWTVQSDASALLMMKFYQLRETKPEAEALAEARCWLRDLTAEKLAEWYQAIFEELSPNDTIRPDIRAALRRAKEKPPSQKLYEHPYYWAAFIMTGESS